jgi:hypothetical protein
MSDIFVKTTTTTGWKKASNIFVKTTTVTGWKAAIGVWIKTATQWLKVWPLSGVFATRTPWVGPNSDTAYSDRLTSSSVIRVGSNYYGNNGIWDANGWTITGYSYAWKYYQGAENYFTPDGTIDSGTGSGWTTSSGQDVLPISIWTATNSSILDEKYLSFNVIANTSNSTYKGDSDSTRIKVVRRIPINTNAALSSYAPQEGESIFYSSSWDLTEARKPDAPRTIIQWYKNLNNSTNGGQLISSGSYSYTVQSSDVNHYIYAVETTFNSGTDYDLGFDTGVEAKVITISTVSGGVSPPTFLTATTNRADGVNLNFGGSDSAVSYDIFWNTYASANPSDAATPDFPGESSPYLDTTIGIGVTRWYWVRAKNSSGQTSSWYPVGNGVTGTRTTEYNVSWNGNGGSSGNEGIPWSFTEGGYVTVPSATRIGYTFSRWTDTPSGDYTYTTTNIGGTFFPPAQNITMYARWIENVCTIPNVIGMSESDASDALNEAGFLYEFTYYINTTDISLNGKVQAVDPAVGTQPGCGTNVGLTIYNYVAKLATPTGLSATTGRTDGIYISWDAVPGADFYGVWYRGGAPSYDSAPDFGGPNNPTLITSSNYLATEIGAGVTRTYDVQAYRSGNPTGSKSDWAGPVTGTRLAPPSAPSGGSVSVSPSSGTAGSTTFTAIPSGWSGNPSTFTYSYSWQRFTNGVYQYQELGTGSTFSPTASQNSSALAWLVVLTVSNGVSPNGTASTNFTVNAPVTCGSCEDYGNESYLGQTAACSGTYYTVYNNYSIGQRKTCSDGTYQYCDDRLYSTVQSSSELDGLCGYVAVTCGSCADYGSANYTGQTWGCVGTYYTVYNNYYIFQRQACSDGTYEECAIRSYNTVSSSTQINGLCGYTEPVACVCNYTDYGSYHYSPQCCPSGAQRTGSLSGSTSGACCPTVNKTLRYNCTNYDVTNSASANYYDCYSVGQCAAQNNASGNRSTCYI